MLQPLEVERLYRGIVNPRQAYADRLEQLRTVRSIDPARYREMKKHLPYFVCGRFHPPVRRRENFASIGCFVLDLDHLAGAGLEPAALRRRLREEVPEVLLCFASPSGDGLKVMCRLDEPCTDAALFSAFYKVFAHRFAQRWGLLQVVDLRTSDVTRACFISVDAEAFYRPDATPVRIGDFVDALNFGKAEKDLREAEKAARAQHREKPKEAGPTDEVLLRIKQKLNPDYRQPRRTKQYFVPPEVDSALAVISEQLADLGMQLVETAPINYGRKLKVAAPPHWAEVNVFYGRRGFTVVKTPKSGSSAELATLAAQAITGILSSFKTGNGNK